MRPGTPALEDAVPVVGAAGPAGGGGSAGGGMEVPFFGVKCVKGER